MNRFTFHETVALASDLARLLQSQDIDPLVGDSATNDAARPTTAHFPGIILLYDNRPCAAIGYTREPGGTVLISEPIVLLDASDEIHRALCERLLKQVKRRTAADGFQRIHFLQQESAGDVQFERLLTEQGFVQKARIIQWEWSLTTGNRDGSGTRMKPKEKTSSPDDQCTKPFHNFAATDGASTHELRNAIDAILECSEDLASQAVPTADALLAGWQHLQAKVFVCRIEQEIAGVMSCATNSITAAKVPSTGMPPETNVCIEYIGVVPVFRQRQVASLMIRQIPKLMSMDTGCGKDGFLSRALKVTAYSDAANTPATRLYQRCGFVQTITRPLWRCEQERQSSACQASCLSFEDFGTTQEIPAPIDG